MALNEDAALRATSWGKFQILGDNYKAAGYPTVKEFVGAMKSGEGEQLRAFVNFIKSQGMVDELQRKDWASFAEKYNGPSYKSNKYDKRLEAAYKKYSGK